MGIYMWILTIFPFLYFFTSAVSLLASSLCIRRQGLVWFRVLRFFIGVIRGSESA